MKSEIQTNAGLVKVGMYIRIDKFDDPDTSYVGKSGIVTFIDDAGQIHGTWGGCAVVPSLDEISILEKAYIL